jgi:predicted ATPase/DNA-binding CsgD family transcriptional regulator
MNNRNFSGDKVQVESLTWREQEILTLLAERLTNREIAGRLYLAESTIKDYVGNILGKLYVKNRREAVERAKALGLLDPDGKSASKPLSNLPAEPTPFVGRRTELEEIKRHLLNTRLLTLTGPGGIGKTRLALRAAVELADDFEDGCFFVPLAPIRSVENIIQTIAEGLKFPIATHEDPQHQLLRYLQKKQLLLVMDNFEHLLDGVGIVNKILEAAPAVKILASSRESLNLQSETNLNIGGMDIPGKEGSDNPLNYDAITLFVQSANKVRPGFDPSPEELEQITNICQTVEGMPLAIELAAAWLHILKVDEIADELEKDLDILAAEVRDAPARHRSIRAVFDHSWSLLDQVEQEIFMLLSVFRGGFTREAAQQVAGASLQLLAGLVKKSFLNHDPDSGRLEVHELLRQYAQERLEKAPVAGLSPQEAHAVYYAEFIRRGRQDLKGKRQMLALVEIEADIENVRAAWRYYLDQRNAPQIWKFIYALWHFHWIRWWNHAGMELFAEAARALQGEDEEESVAVRALAMACQSYFMAWLDLAKQGYEMAQESVETLEQLNHPEALVFAYNSLTVNAYFVYRYAEEVEATNKMLKITAEMDDKWLLAFSYWAASLSCLVQGDYDEARRLAETNLKLYEEIGDVIGSTEPLIVLGHVALARGELESARGFYLRCLKISQETGFHYSIQTSSKYLSRVAISLGKTDEAEKYLVQSLIITREIGFVRDKVNLLYEYARLLVAQDNLEGAAELLALVIQHPASHQYRMMEGSIRDSAKGLLVKLEIELPPKSYAAALERGQQLELDEIIADLIGSKRRK